MPPTSDSFLHLAITPVYLPNYRVEWVVFTAETVRGLQGVSEYGRVKSYSAKLSIGTAHNDASKQTMYASRCNKQTPYII